MPAFCLTCHHAHRFGHMWICRGFKGNYAPKTHDSAIMREKLSQLFQKFCLDPDASCERTELSRLSLSASIPTFVSLWGKTVFCHESVRNPCRKPKVTTVVLFMEADVSRSCASAAISWQYLVGPRGLFRGWICFLLNSSVAHNFFMWSRMTMN